MAADFEILSQLSGMGTATIRVKPKANNTSGSVKEQVLRVTVRGVEREVTLVQNYGTEEWVNSFSYEPSDSTINFSGDKQGEAKVLNITSHQQKIVNGEAGEYKDEPWVAITDVDWIELTAEDATEPEGIGKLTIKTKSNNPETEARSAEVILKQTSGKASKTITVNQSGHAPVVSSEYIFNFVD